MAWHKVLDSHALPEGRVTTVSVGRRSLAVSNYEAVRAQADFVERSRRDEEHHIDHIPEGEREEIRQIFAGKGSRAIFSNASWRR